MRNVTWQLAAALLLAAMPLRAQEDCDAKRAALRSAQSVLRECIGAGKSCNAEFEAKRAAEEAAAGCPEPTPAAVAPPVAEAPASAKIAVVVDAPNAAIVDAAAREALSGADVLDAGTVRAARAFLGASAGADDALAKLRTSVNADRLIAIDVKAEGATRFVGVRAIDAQGTSRNFAETNEADLAATVKRLVASLPAAPAPGPVAAVTPAAVVTVATPTPAAVRHDRHDDDEDELRYAKKGTFTFSMESNVASSQGTFDAGIGDLSFDERAVQSNPSISYFLADGVFVGVGVFTDLYGYSNETDATRLDNESGVTAGAGYFAKMGPIFVGPQLQSRYRLRGVREEDSTGDVFNYEQSTLETIASLGIRFPVGTKRGGVLNANVYFRQVSALYTYDIDGDLRATSVGVTQGFSIFF